MPLSTLPRNPLAFVKPENWLKLVVVALAVTSSVNAKKKSRKKPRGGAGVRISDLGGQFVINVGGATKIEGLQIDFSDNTVNGQPVPDMHVTIDSKGSSATASPSPAP